MSATEQGLAGPIMENSCREARDALLAAIGARAAELPSLGGLFLSGSCARGLEDEHSDLDLVGVAEPPQHAQAVAEWKALLGSLASVVLWNERRQGATLLNAVTDGWLRCDLAIAPRSLFMLQAQDLVRPIRDPHGLYESLPETRRSAPVDPRQLEQTISEFIRVLGLLAVVDAREEHVVGAAGAGMLRDLLRELMLVDVPQAYRGGALHLKRLLGAEDMARIEGLPYPRPEREAVLAAHVATAAVFLPRARSLAAAHGATWPSTFEAATKRALASRFGDHFDGVLD